MKHATLTCQGCCAPMHIRSSADRVIKCEYCGLEYYLDDQDMMIPREKEKAIQEQKERQDRQIRDDIENRERLKEDRRKKRETRILLGLFIVSLLCALAIDTGFWKGICVVSFIGFLVVKSKPTHSELQRYRILEEQGIHISDKNRWIALGLCVFLGMIGGHLFYARRYGKAILYIFTFGLFGIGVIVDFFTILTGRFLDADKRLVM